MKVVRDGREELKDGIDDHADREDPRPERKHLAQRYRANSRVGSQTTLARSLELFRPRDPVVARLALPDATALRLSIAIDRCGEALVTLVPASLASGSM